MSASKRPSTSSLRRFITSRPYVTVAELRRRFGLDDPDAMARLTRDGDSAWVGLPEREAAKLQDLWERNELGVELSVEVRAPVVVGVYPMRIARYVTEGMLNGNGSGNGNGNGMRPRTSDGVREAGASREAVNRLNGGSGVTGGASTGGASPAGGGFADRRNDSAPWRGDRRDPSPEQRHAPRPMPGAPSYGTGASPLSASEDGSRS